MIFLGAGASNSFNIKTSPELTKILKEKITDENPSLLEDIITFYTEAVGIEPDFETMLTQLTAFTDPAQITPTHNSLIFVRQNQEYAGDYSEVIKDMYKEVIGTCTNPFIEGSDNYLKPMELDDVFSKTYDALFGAAFMCRQRNAMVFTTNYDPSIELWCQKRNIECMDGTAGIFNPEIKRVLSPVQHINRLRDFFNARKYSDKSIGLVRLHGSIWTYKRPNSDTLLKFNRPADRLAFPDLYTRIRTEMPRLIFPGQEDTLRIGRWDEYYQYFKDNLQSNCLFIGYSFRHSVINEQVRSCLDSNKIRKLGIFAPNPDKLLENLFQGRDIPDDKIVRIKGFFGTEEGLEELNRNWFDKALERNWKPRYFYQQSLEWREKTKTHYY